MTVIVQSMYKGHMFYHFVCLNTYTKNLEVKIHVHTFFFTYVQGVYIHATCTDDGTVHRARLLEIMVLKRLIFITFII